MSLFRRVLGLPVLSKTSGAAVSVFRGMCRRVPRLTSGDTLGDVG